LKIREILSTCVIESKKITPDILNAMLLLAEKAQNEARKGRNKKLIDAWDRLIESLNNIFEQADPNLSNNKWGSLGLNLASSIERAMEI
jgi:dsDNA-binding SOS-regulon protein